MNEQLIRRYTETNVHADPLEFAERPWKMCPETLRKPSWLHITNGELFGLMANQLGRRAESNPLRRFIFNRMSDPNDVDFAENCQMVIDYTCMAVAFEEPGGEERVLEIMPERIARFLMGKYLDEIPELFDMMPSQHRGLMKENIDEYRQTKDAIIDFVEGDMGAFRTVLWLVEQTKLGRTCYSQKQPVEIVERDGRTRPGTDEYRPVPTSNIVKRKEMSHYDRYDNRPQNLSREELDYRRRRDAEDRRQWEEERRREDEMRYGRPGYDRGYDRGAPRDRGFNPDDRYRDGPGYDRGGRGYHPDDRGYHPNDRGYRPDDRGYHPDDRGGYREDPRRAAWEADMRHQRQIHRDVSIPANLRTDQGTPFTESRSERQAREKYEAAQANGTAQQPQPQRREERPAQQYSSSQLRGGRSYPEQSEPQVEQRPQEREYIGDTDVTGMTTSQKEQVHYAYEARKARGEVSTTVVRKDTVPAPAPETRREIPAPAPESFSTVTRRTELRVGTPVQERANASGLVNSSRNAGVVQAAKAILEEKGQAEEVWNPEDHSAIVSTSGEGNFFRQGGQKMRELRNGEGATHVTFTRTPPPAPPAPEKEPTTPPPAPPTPVETVIPERVFFIELKPHRTTIVGGKSVTLEDQKKPGRLYDIQTLEQYRGESEVDMMQHAVVYQTAGLPKADMSAEYKRVQTAVQALQEDELKYTDIAHLVDDNVTNMVAENNIESCMRSARLQAMENSLDHEASAGSATRRVSRMLALNLNTNVTFKSNDVLKDALRTCGTMDKLHSVLNTALRTLSNANLVDTPDASDIRSAIAFVDRIVTEDLNRFLVDVLGVVPAGQRAIDSFVSDYQAMLKALTEKFHVSTYESFLAFSVKYMRGYQEALNIPDMDINEAAYQLTGASEKMDVLCFPSVNLITTVPFTVDELGLPSQAFKVDAKSPSLIRALIIGDANVLKNLTGVEHANQFILTRDQKAYKVSRDTHDKSIVVLSPVKL